MIDINRWTQLIRLDRKFAQILFFRFHIFISATTVTVLSELYLDNQCKLAVDSLFSTKCLPYRYMAMSINFIASLVLVQ